MFTCPVCRNGNRKCWWGKNQSDGAIKLLPRGKRGQIENEGRCGAMRVDRSA